MEGEHPTGAVAISRGMKPPSGREQTEYILGLYLLILRSSPISGTQLEPRRQESPDNVTKEFNI